VRKGVPCSPSYQNIKQGSSRDRKNHRNR